MKKFLVLSLILSLVWACGQQNAQEEAEMYDPSPLSQMMRTMEQFSEGAKLAIIRGESIEVPQEIYGFPSLEATRGEHKEDLFQGMTGPYLNALKGIERGDSQAYYYQASIQACKNCHSYYCAGPLAAIKQLELEE